MLKLKSMSVISLAISVIGIIIAMTGIYSTSRYGKDTGQLLTWTGVAIALVFSLVVPIFMAPQMKKLKDKEIRSLDE
ncbi:MAG: hypothetical protein H7Z37_03485 [Pyrinomonadaceae bacterium]|nr:hypothetical protein [Pyrinomonadaceae bacterium]